MAEKSVAQSHLFSMHTERLGNRLQGEQDRYLQITENTRQVSEVSKELKFQKSNAYYSTSIWKG